MAYGCVHPGPASSTGCATPPPREGKVSLADLDLLVVTDDLDLVVETVLAAAVEQGV